MSTAIVGFEKSFNGRVFEKAEKIRASHYKQKAKPLRASKSIFKKLFFTTVILSLFSIIAAAIASFYLYNHFSAVVDKRIASGFWQSRAGIYAAPNTLRAKRKINLEQVASMLRRAGYVEGANADFYNGSFRRENNFLFVNTNNPQQETVRIEFSKDEILSVTNQGAPIEGFAIEGEMLSGNSEAKRDANNTLKFDEIPELLRNAIIVTEDKRFFEHNGVDYQGILRALRVNVSSGELKQGGSTITQQLVKNTFLSNEKTLKRKISEAFLALGLESKMSKEDIFALYCNEVYFGQHGITGVHGVEQASRVYFGKELKDLNVSESAMIAAMIKSPNHFSPAKNYEEAKSRRDLVIKKLNEVGVISNADAENALKQEIALAPQKNDANILAPYFVDSVLKQLPNKVNGETLKSDDNLRVYTTIDPQLQAIAEDSVNKQLSKLDKIYAAKGLTAQATLIALDPKTGEVLAMVGGRDYDKTQFNRATEAKRQPGSTFKPFVYAAAIEKGIMPFETFSDKPMTFSYVGGKDYKPANYGNSYANQEISMKTALAKSSNVVAVQTGFETGLERVTKQAREFGFEIPAAYPSTALGTHEVTPLELAAAYATFANEGKKVSPTFISKVISGEGDVIFQNNSKNNPEIISPKTAFMMTDMLTAVVERGTARSAKNALGKDVVFAGKTGSSKDGWFVGYTPNLVTVVWIGFDDNEDIGFTGGEVALPTWVDFMKQAIDFRPELGGSNFSMPNGLVEMKIDTETGMLADEFCPFSEIVVVPATYASNVKCLKHQPQLPETTLALSAESYETTEISFEQNIPAETTEDNSQHLKTEDQKEYKQINGVPMLNRNSPRVSNPDRKIEAVTSPKEKSNKSDFEQIDFDEWNSIKNATKGEGK